MAPSKTFNLAGLSTSSVIISDPALRKSFNRFIESLHVGNGNIFGTIASIAAYTNGHEWLDELIDHILTEILSLLKIIADQMIPEIIPVSLKQPI